MKTYYSKKLNLNYKIKQDLMNNQIVVFEDDTNYSSYEMKKLHGLSDLNLNNIHKIKNIFNGVVL